MMNNGRQITNFDRWTVHPLFSKTILTTMAVVFGSGIVGGAEKTQRTVIADKTLVAWVAPANLTQRGGSVLTIEKSGGTFDAIVFGEIAESKWMAGSDGFSRTQKRSGRLPGRDGRRPDAGANRHRLPGPSRSPSIATAPSTPTTRRPGSEQFGGDSLVLMGLRHLDARPDNRFFTGSIDDARIYGVALERRADRRAEAQPAVRAPAAGVVGF